MSLATGAIGGWVALRAGAFLRIATMATACMSLYLGIATFATQDVLDAAGRQALLGAFIATIVAQWALAALRHSGIVPSGPASGMRHA